MQTIRAVLFDLDGTLLNTLDNITAAVNHTLSAYEMPLRTSTEVRSFVGNGVVSLIARAVPANTDENTTRQVLADFRTYYAAHTLDLTAPYDGVLSALARLQNAGVAMAIVSNKPNGSVETLRQHFFADYIDVALGDSPDYPRKPSPESALLALNKLGVPAEQAVFVGDGDADVLTAQNLSIPCLGVRWGFRDADVLLKLGARAVFDTPEALVEEILERK